MASVGSNLTKKAGPLPVWAWAVLALVAFYLYSHRSTSAAAQTPVTSNATPSIAPSSGQGNAADNMSSDALAALLGSYQDINSNLLNTLVNAPYGTKDSFNTTTTNTYNTTGYTISGPSAGGSGVPTPSISGSGGGGYPGGYIGADMGPSGGVYVPAAVGSSGGVSSIGLVGVTRQAAAPTGKTYIQ